MYAKTDRVDKDLLNERRDSNSNASYISIERNETDETEIIDSYEKGLGWKNIVFLPFNGVWQTVIISTTMLYYVVLLYDYHFIQWRSKLIRTGATIKILFELLYLIDIILSVIYKIWTRVNIVNVNSPRSTLHLCIDVFSILPLARMTDLAVSPDDHSVRILMYLLGGNHLFRIYRVFFYFHTIRHSVGSNIVFMRFVEYVIYVLIMTQTSSAILIQFACMKSSCAKEYTWATHFLDENKYMGITILEDNQVSMSGNTELRWYILSFYVMLCHATGKGFPGVYVSSWYIQLLFLLVTVTSLLLFIGFIISFVISATVLQNYDIHSFSQRLAVVKRELVGLNVKPEVCEEVGLYYQVLWKKWRGCQQVSNITYMLPTIKIKDVKLDIFGDFFKRSHMFSIVDEPFLRLLCLEMKVVYYLKGDILFEKDEIRSKMVYIVTGVVQFLSTEDDDAPIISFSGGTLLGGSSLLVNYHNCVTVRCATYCEVQVLEKRDFCNILRLFPMQHRALRKQILERCDVARQLTALGKFGGFDAENDTIHFFDKSKESSIKWIKSFMNGCLNKTHSHSGVLEFKTIYDHVNHCLTYMNLYVITEQLELVFDSVCLRVTWPWILQPDSNILQVWNKFIIMVSLIMSMIIPYYAFYTNYPPWLNAVIYIITVLYCADVYIQTTTAIQDRTELVSDWHTILLRRLLEVGFIVDVIAALPMELLVYVLSDSYSSEELGELLRLNRVLKLWKFEKFYSDLDNSFHPYASSLKIFKVLTYSFISIYICGGVMYAVACWRNICSSEEWYSNVINAKQFDNSEAFHRVAMSLYYVATVSTGVSSMDLQPTTINDIWLTCILVMLGAFVYVYAMGVGVGRVILRNTSRSNFQESVRVVRKFMSDNNVSMSIQKRVMDYMYTSWLYNNASNVIYGQNAIFDIPPELHEKVYGPALTGYLSSVPLFNSQDERFLRKIASVAHVCILPSGATISKRGELATQMCIIMHGFCELESGSGVKMNKIIGSSGSFSVIETCLQIPSINTVRTLTTCQLIVIKYKLLQQVLTMFPNMQAELEELVSSCSGWKQLSELQDDKISLKSTPSTVNVGVRQQSWYSFSYIQIHNTPREADYLKPFRNLGRFEFLRFLLLRRTIVSDGPFLFYWEISRIVFAMLSAMLTPATGVLARYTWIVYIYFLLDFTAYLDLYVRLHVAYFNDNGVIVNHPLKTASYYLKHGFLLDLLAVAPIEFFSLSAGVAKNILDAQSNIFYLLRFNRMLQAHRIISGLNVFYNNKASYLFISVKFVVVYLLLYNTVGSLFVLGACSYENSGIAYKSGLYTYGIDCGADSWVATSLFNKPLSPGQVYLYGVYWAGSILSRASLPGITVSSDSMAIIVIVLAVLGILVFTKHLFGWVILSRMTTNADLTIYQEKMKSLMKFISTSKVPKEIRKEAIMYFELKWRRKSGNGAHSTLGSLYESLQKDTLYDIYSRSLRECSIFERGGRSFYCQFLLSCEERVFLKGAIILRLNDVQGFLFVMRKGQADVLGADGTKLCPVLGVGSLFGNLQNVSVFRQTCTIVARGHCDVLMIPAVQLYEILARHVKLLKLFKREATHNKVYVLQKKSANAKNANGDSPSKSDTHIHTSSSSSNTTGSKSGFSRLFSQKAIVPSTFVFVIKVLTIVVGAYFTYVLTLYQLAMQEFHLALTVCLYLLDFLQVIKILMKLHLAYEDDSGYLVKDLKLIRKQYLRSPYGFVLDFVSLIPFELFAFAAPLEKRWFVFSWLRINRLGRIATLMEYIRHRSNQLSINVFRVRFGFLVLCMSVLMHTFTCIFQMILCHQKICDYEQWSFRDRFLEYFASLYTVVTMLSTSPTMSHNIFLPHSIELTVFCIFFAISTELCIATFIGETCTVLEITNSTLALYSRHLRRITEFYKRSDISEPREKELESYLRYLWTMNHGKHVPELLSAAPYYIKEGIKNSLYGEHIYKNVLFSSCHEDFLRQITTHLQQVTFLPGNLITYAGDADNNMYFVHLGEVEYLSYHHNDEEVVEGVLVERDVFGMMQGIYTNQQHKYTYRARTVVVILILSRTDWLDILIKFPASHKSIHNKAKSLDLTV